MKRYNEYLNEKIDSLQKLYDEMMQKSVEDKFMEGVLKAIEFGADIDKISLSLACSNGFVDLIEFLINTEGGDRDINKSDGYYTPLGRAIQHNHIDAVKKLIELGANKSYAQLSFYDYNRKKYPKLTAIQLAEEQGRTEILNYLRTI